MSVRRRAWAAPSLVNASASSVTRISPWSVAASIAARKKAWPLYGPVSHALSSSHALETHSRSADPRGHDPRAHRGSRHGSDLSCRQPSAHATARRRRLWHPVGIGRSGDGRHAHALRSADDNHGGLAKRRLRRPRQRRPVALRLSGPLWRRVVWGLRRGHALRLDRAGRSARLQGGHRHLDRRLTGHPGIPRFRLRPAAEAILHDDHQRQHLPQAVHTHKPVRRRNPRLHASPASAGRRDRRRRVRCCGCKASRGPSAVYRHVEHGCE